MSSSLENGIWKDVVASPCIICFAYEGCPFWRIVGLALLSKRCVTYPNVAALPPSKEPTPARSPEEGSPWR